MACQPRQPPAGHAAKKGVADTLCKHRRYPGGLYALCLARLPAGGGALELGGALCLSPKTPKT